MIRPWDSSHASGLRALPPLLWVRWSVIGIARVPRCSTCACGCTASASGRRGLRGIKWTSAAISICHSRVEQSGSFETMLVSCPSSPWQLEETTTDSHESTVSVGIQAALACENLGRISAVSNRSTRGNARTRSTRKRWGWCAVAPTARGNLKATLARPSMW